MTQHNENGSRLDRIETILLDLAAASIRHDNTVSRHDEEFSRINHTLQETVSRHDEEFSRINHTLQEITEAQKRTEVQQQANIQAIAHRGVPLRCSALAFCRVLPDC